MSKTISVSEDVWKELHRIRIDRGYRTLEDVIIELLKQKGVAIESKPPARLSTVDELRDSLNDVMAGLAFKDKLAPKETEDEFIILIKHYLPDDDFKALQKSLEPYGAKYDPERKGFVIKKPT